MNRSIPGWALRSTVLFVVSVVCVIAGGVIVAGGLPPDTPSEPGLVSPGAGLLIMAAAGLTVVVALVRGLRWSGWRLALIVGLVYYGAVTVLMQVETWYFLSGVTVGPELLSRLFLMGVPTAAVLVPAAVWLLGAGRPPLRAPAAAEPMRAGQWAWKLALVAVAYLVLYWGAGYFIAWQNPELRAFYGRSGPPLPFLSHTVDTLRNEPLLFPFQILRSQLWVLCALPVIRGSRLGVWATAGLVGILFSLPQNAGLLMENPLIPVASVRLSHLIETSTSTFVFGAIVVWLLHRPHRSVADLIGIARGGRRHVAAATVLAPKAGAASEAAPRTRPLR